MPSTNVKMPLSGNILKFIAAMAMLCDHIGLIFFPKLNLLRGIGRLAFPIFAFFISEGCKYTRNRTKYLCTMAILAAVFQIVYYFVMHGVYLSIFATFTLSILLIYLLDEWKKSFFEEKAGTWKKVLLGVTFIASVGGMYALNLFIDIDYGFFGLLTPVLASLLVAPKNAPEGWKSVDKLPLRILCMLPSLVVLCFIANNNVQYCAFFALLLLLLYSGKRGKYNMKYFFYLFYPLHLVVLYGIAYLL